MKEAEKQLSVIKRNTVEVIEETELKAKIEKSLSSNTPLRIKYGIDPTAPDIHLGHTVPIKKLKEFQELGHKVFFLIGDFTAKIGDPTGRNETRPILSDRDIKRNLSRYREQAGKILDIEKTEFVYNSQWLASLTLEEIIRLTSFFTIARILERDDFSKRYRDNKPIFMQEFLYPLLQGYDSCALEADVELGATEQKFNLLAGRTMQEAMGQSKQVVITMPILVGTDGRMKMSKSYNNHIPVESQPQDMYGRLMSITDGAMEEYYRLLTLVDERTFRNVISADPRQAKANLALEVVKEYFGEEKALEAGREFDRIFREKQAPSDIPEFAVKQEIKDAEGRVSIIELICMAGLASSKSEARRLVIQKAVKLDDRTVEDPSARISVMEGQVLKAGKRKFIRLK
ncbi:MAG TPA: tyrosine--tRNA ligase [bacterium]|nr:tyrosine--tRNA ligase [bacterium]